MGSISYSGGVLTLTPTATAAVGQNTLTIPSADANTLHHLRFVLEGLPGDGAIVRVGTTEGASDIHRGAHLVGVHICEFTPNATTAYLQFEARDHTVKVKDIELLSNVPLELPTPWAEDMVDDLRYVQSNDVMTVTHPATHPRDVIRKAAASFSIEEFPNRDGPYLDENPDDTLTIALSDNKGSVTATASRALFTASDVGRHLSIRTQGEWGWGIIRAVASATSATLDIQGTLRQGPRFTTTVATQSWTYSEDGTAITDLVIGAATGGEGTVAYSAVGLPAGLIFEKSTRTISGTPQGVGSGIVRITAEDENGDAGTLEFNFTVTE